MTTTDGNVRDLRVPRIPVWVGAEAEARLQRLGLPGSGPLIEATRDGAAGARATNDDHPKSYSGDRMWGEAVASLRVHTREHGWTAQHFLGVDMVVNASTGVAIIVTAGTAATGLANYQPGVRYARQKVTRSLVNGHADTLFGRAPRPEWDVWLLLHHLGPTVLRTELSRPAGIDNSGQVPRWLERVLLPIIAFGRRNEDASQVGPAPIDTVPEVDFHVTRRPVQ